MINSLISRKHNRVKKIGNKVAKTSKTNFEKLFDEYEWYISAKEFGITNLNVEKIPNGYKMDFIEGDNLGEVFWHLSLSQQKNIVDDFLNFISKNRNENSQNKLIKELLIEKFEERVDVLKTKHRLALNDEIAFYKEKIFSIFKKVENMNCLMHGDLFFGNTILSKSGHLNFIDPRGKSKKWGIFGNCYYELIKLAHSVHGKYDLLIFNQKRARNNAKISDYFFQNVVRIFDISKSEILIGELGLFISMLPIHVDDEKRQDEIIKTAKKIYKEITWKD